jgi:hypothetical protein
LNRLSTSDIGNLSMSNVNIRNDWKVVAKVI